MESLSHSIFLLYSQLPTFTCLIVAFLLFSKKEKHGFSAKIMGANMLLFSMLSLSYLGAPEADYLRTSKVDIAYFLVLLWIIPLYAVYFCFLTENKVRLRVVLWFFIPPLIYMSIIALLYAIVGQSNTILFTHNVYADIPLPTPDTWDYKLLTLFYWLLNPLIVVETVCVIIYISKLLRRYSRRLSDYYSNIDDKDQKNDYFIFYITIALLVFTSLYSFIISINAQAEGVLIKVSYLIFSILFFLVGNSVLNIRFSAADMEYELEQRAQEENTEEININGSAVNDTVQSNLENLDKRLQELLNKEQLHLQADLTLDSLVARLYTNRTYLSLLFNQVYGMHFYDYINILRVKHAEKLLSDPNSGLSLDEIWTESGFSAKSSFYRIFKQINGKTPLAWRKNLQNETNF